MKQLMVRYKVKADRVAENEKYVRAVFEQLEKEKTPGIRYASFKLADGVSFVHLATIKTADGKSPLAGLATFKDFQAELKDRCEEPPVPVDLTEIGSYGLLEE